MNKPATAAAKAAQTRRAREYETIYIMRASVDNDEAERVASRVKEIITGLKGKLLKVENWGRRRLAYTIKRETRGVFVYFRYAGYDDVVAEIERNLRLTDSIIRYQTILVKPVVAIEELAVEPTDVEFQRLEIAEEEEEPGIAQRLGLVERPRPPRPEGEAAASGADFDEESEPDLSDDDDMLSDRDEAEIEPAASEDDEEEVAGAADEEEEVK